MNDHTSAIYTINEIELSCSIRLRAVYDENQTEQQHNQSIGLVYMEKLKLNNRDLSDWVRSIMKTR